MIVALAALVSGVVAQEESPRLRTLLPNGVALIVERMPEARPLSVQLFASARGVEETPQTHGWRHLLEHLILKGKDGTLDDRLEAEGVFFVGRTYRDAMQIEFTGRPTKLGAIIDAVSELLQPLKTTPEAIAKEAAVMGEEFAALSDSTRLSRTAWDAAFGEQALDPFGTLETMAKATPEGIEALRARHFTPANLVVAVCGAVDPERVTADLRARLEDLEGPAVEAKPPRKGGSGRREADDAFGEVRGARVEGLTEAGAALCAAYGIASRLTDAFVTYTPSVGEGLVLVGRTDANNTVGVAIDAMTEGDEAAVFAVGKALAEQWVRGLLARPGGSAYLRGLLMAQSAAARPEMLLEAVRRTGWPEFRAAIARFKRDHAAIAVGVR